MTVVVPESFRRMPRWRPSDEAWLDRLPALVAEHLARWDLRLDQTMVWHGSNALVVPVFRADEPLALRLAPPQDRVEVQAEALRFWAGRGTVRLVHSAAAAGVLLLERLDGSRTLAAVALAEAVPRIALVMNRLAVPAPPDAPSTAELVSARRTTLEREWQTLGRPLPKRSLAIAQDAGLRLAGSSADTAVNGDLHYDQLLRGQREPWLVVDPVLLRGDIEYDLARLLWTRLDEMADSADIRHWFDVIVATAGLDPERAWAWVVFRTVDYWLWGLANGLTEDPKRCRRLLEVFVR